MGQRGDLRAQSFSRDPRDAVFKSTCAVIRKVNFITILINLRLVVPNNPNCIDLVRFYFTLTSGPIQVLSVHRNISPIQRREDLRQVETIRNKSICVYLGHR